MIAGSTCAVAAFADNFIPEIFGNVAVIAIAGEFVITRCGNHLRDVCVHVQSLEFIAMGRERIEEPFLVEALRNMQVIGLAGDGIQIREHLAHATIFSAEDALHVVVT